MQGRGKRAIRAPRGPKPRAQMEAAALFLGGNGQNTGSRTEEKGSRRKPRGAQGREVRLFPRPCTGVKEELPSTAPTASTASQDNGEGKTSSPSARLCSCQGTIASPKKGPQRARSFTSVVDRACKYDSHHSDTKFQQPRQQQQQASSSPHATAAQQNAALLISMIQVV